MDLQGIASEWKEEVKDLYAGLQNLESQKQEVAQQIKNSELGKRRSDLTARIRKLKKMIDQRRFELSGLEKALNRASSKASGRIRKIG
jgi:seryl-tRNA synthetase